MGGSTPQTPLPLTSIMSVSSSKSVKRTTVDAKLLHLVKKIVATTTTTETNEDGFSTAIMPQQAQPNIDYIVTILRTQHKEYLRKDVVELKRQVELAVQQLLASEATGGHRKRKSPDGSEHQEDDDDDEYDRAVAEQEALREQAMAHDGDGGGGLNASFRERYKQVQQDQQAKERQEQDATTKKAASKLTPKKRKGLLKQQQQQRSNSHSQSGTDNPVPDFMNPVSRPDERYKDLGGMDAIILELQQLVEYPIIRPELYAHLGIDPPRGVLLRGPPGTGKSHLANAGRCR